MSISSIDLDNKGKLGHLYGVGVGPGDPELLTIKAARILSKTPVIFAPKKLKESTSNACTVISNLITEKHKVVGLVLPMLKDKEQLVIHWRLATDTIWKHLASGQDCAFINLGDPLLYGSFIYIMDMLRQEHPDLSIEIIPGITSITAAAASTLLPLAIDDDKIAILSGKCDRKLIEDTLNNFNTIVFLKIYKIFRQLFEILTDLNMLGKCIYVKRCSMQDQEIITDLRKVNDANADYFSILIFRR